MIKIGIMTFHYATNFGAVLQAYALFKYLKKQGHEVYFINYFPKDHKEVKLNRIATIFKVFFQNPRTTVDKIRLKFFLNIVAKKREKFFSEGFLRFKNENFIFTKKYYSLKQLQDDPPEMDVYITGSDQVWSCGDFGFNKAFFLQFGDKRIRRLSYAASFGKPQLPENFLNSLNSLLKNFEAISVREPSGVKLIETHTNFKATRTLDPTLLLQKTDYDSIKSEKLSDEIKSPYLLVYRLHQNWVLERKMSLFVNRIAQQYNFKIVTVSTNGFFKYLESGIQIHPSPPEFIGLIDNASLFITNSFHGVIFSVINKTPFYCLPRYLEKNNANTRMVEILNDLGLSNRYVECDNFTNCSFDLDWLSVHKRLDALRINSYNFLKL